MKLLKLKTKADQDLHSKKAFICDMDGVIYHGRDLLPGVKEFLNWLRINDKKFIFLTNCAVRSQQQIHQKLAKLGIDVELNHIYSSAMATAEFLQKQKPGGSAYVIGSNSLRESLQLEGYRIDDQNPDYVVVSDSDDYNYTEICNAVTFVRRGAKLIGTNPDVTGPTERGIMPGTGSLVMPIELATGAKTYFIGKPNPVMMRQAHDRLGCHSKETVMIGDRMDTDIVGGIESEFTTVLVLSGVTQKTDIAHYAYQPDYVLTNVGDVC